MKTEIKSSLQDEVKTEIKSSLQDEVKTEIKSSLQDEVKTEIKSSLQDEVKTEIKSSLQDEVRKELYEIEDQRQRALNLIVFNLPECQSRISSERKKYDNAKYMELYKVIGVDEPDLKVAFRLGNPKEGVVRPLKVVMNNKKHPRQCFQAKTTASYK